MIHVPFLIFRQEFIRRESFLLFTLNTLASWKSILSEAGWKRDPYEIKIIPFHEMDKNTYCPEYKVDSLQKRRARSTTVQSERHGWNLTVHGQSYNLAPYAKDSMG